MCNGWDDDVSEADIIYMTMDEFDEPENDDDFEDNTDLPICEFNNVCPHYNFNSLGCRFYRECYIWIQFNKHLEIINKNETN